MSDPAPASQAAAAGSAAAAGKSWPRRVVYGVALALAIVLIVFFGWAGFWLGLSLVVLARVGVWAAPLVKLSYADPASGLAAAPRPSPQLAQHSSERPAHHLPEG